MSGEEPLCDCGHPIAEHYLWWDDGNGQSGMACTCERCDNFLARTDTGQSS